MKRVPVLPAILMVTAAGAAHAQTLSVDKTTVNFTALSNGPAVTQTLTVTSTALNTPFSLTLSSSGWLTATPVVGSTPTTVTITANPTGLPSGTYAGSIRVSGGLMPDPVVTVNFSVGNIGVNPQSVSFSFTQGGAVPSPAALTLTGSPTSFTTQAATTSGGTWLQASPASGTSPGTVTVSLNAAVVQPLAVGTYNGSVTITPTSGAVLTPIVIPVTLSVTAAPPVTASPSTININYQIGGVNNTTQQTLTLSTTSTQPLSYSLLASVDNNPSGAVWILTNPPAGSIPANGSTTTTISYDASRNLPAGTWNGKVNVSTPGGAPPQQDVAVSLFVSNAPLLNVPSATLAFNHQLGGAVPAAQAVTATSTAVAAGSATGQMALTIAANTNNTGNWLVVPATGVTGTAFQVSVNPAGLAPGTYSGAVTVTGAGAGNPPQTIPVRLVVANDPQIVTTVNGCSTLAQSCPALFPVQIGQAAPAVETVPVTSSTGALLNYAATAATTTCGGAWLVLGGATTGATGSSFMIGVNASGVAAGTQCTGTVTVNATNPMTGASAPNSPVTIPVTMYVSSTALVSVRPGALTFNAQVSGAQPAAQQVTVLSTSPTENLNYTVAFATTSGGNWLLVGPLSGSTASGSNLITVQALPGLLSGGTYAGTLTITATNPSSAPVADSPITIPVTFTLNAGTMSVSPANLSFTQTAGGAAPAAQAIAVASSGPALNWAATVSTGGTGNWLTASPANGTTPGNISVTVDGGSLSPGTYNGTVTVTSLTPFAAGSPATVNVQLVVSAGTISATPASLTFNQAQNGPAPATQKISVAGTPGAISYTVTTNVTVGSWLSAAPSSGTTPSDITVSANGAGLGPGTYQGTVTIAATGAGATGSPISIPVTFNVLAPQTFTVSPATLSFTHTIGAAAPAAQTVQLTSSGVAQFTATANVTGGGTWLAVTPASGSTPASLSVSINPQGLAAGSYTGRISIASPASPSAEATAIAVSLIVLATAPPAVTVVRSNASFAVGAIAAGQNIVIGGTNLGPAELAVAQPTNSVYPTTVGETRVTFDGIAAPIYYASATQTSVFVPYEIAGRPTATVRVTFRGVQSEPLVVNLAQAAPGIYTQNSQGFGPGAILNQDFTINTATLPAAKGSIVSVYMTGEGATTPTPPNGAVAPTDGTGLFRTTLPVTATVGGIPATVQYYGSAPGIIYGVMQVNLEIPANAPSGSAVPIVITVGGAPSQNGVTVAVQ